MKYRILLTEDDNVIASTMAKALVSWGYEVRCTEDFSDVMHEFAEFAPQLVLLDISLPFFNGYHRCREIRKVSSVPVIFISSASDNMNIVMAMNMGGDDFIAKPFDLGVLVAKVQAMIRRTYDFASSSSFIEASGAILNMSDMTLRIGEENVELTKNEYRILEALMKNKGRVVTREELMQALWETDSYIDDNTLTVNVTRLRRKLTECGCDIIRTKKGVGYTVN